MVRFKRVSRPGLHSTPLFPSPETSSSSLKVGASVFIGVGAVTMFMGFLGCIGAIKEVRCLLGLVSAAGPPRGAGWGRLVAVPG